MERHLEMQAIQAFLHHLRVEEKSTATVEKYYRDLTTFRTWCNGRYVCKECVIKYKEYLLERYAATSVNSMLAAINGFLAWTGWGECRVKAVRIQRETFAARDRELTKAEYLRLLETAKQKKSRRLFYLLETICATGIRVSELKFITVETLRDGRASVRCKGKNRTIFLPKKLCAMLRNFSNTQGIRSGSVFVTKSGQPLDRSNIWHDMKQLCKAAGVAARKVFPHNLRHLFARTYYKLEKNLDCLAALLGHSSINTTRIYTMTTDAHHERQIERLNLLC